MNPHFNKLTPPKAERLAILMEEMGEAQHKIGKILRHGYDSKDPTDESGLALSNKESLEDELGHVRAAMIMLCEAGDLDRSMIHSSADTKMITVKKWTHHQRVKK